MLTQECRNLSVSTEFLRAKLGERLSGILDASDDAEDVFPKIEQWQRDLAANCPKPLREVAAPAAAPASSPASSGMATLAPAAMPKDTPVD